MQNNLISVIVPVYKVEEYLCECLDSIINQTYKNLEIILVDDGSPDNCGKICDDYALKDSRIKVIHQQNGGLSAARNAGLDIAAGDYIGFVDSDDYIDLNMYEELYNSLKANDADIAVCGVKQFGNRSNSFVYGNGYMNGTDLLKSILKEEVQSGFCNKLFKNDLFNEIRFPVGQFYEDLQIFYLVAEKVKCVGFTDNTFYYYRSRNNSITSDASREIKTIIKSANDRTKKYKNTEFYTCAVAGEFRWLRLVVSEMSVSKSKSEEYMYYYKKSHKLYSVCKNELSAFQKTISLLYFISPKLYYYIKCFALKAHIFS